MISCQLKPAQRHRLCAALLLAPLLAACSAPQPITQAAESASKTVEVVVDYGDGAQRRFGTLPWHEEITVLDALALVQQHPRGVKFTQRGDGPMAFVVSIDDLTNEGGGENAKNWTFRVNRELAQKGAGAYELAPSDIVEWKFETFRETP